MLRNFPHQLVLSSEVLQDRTRKTTCGASYSTSKPRKSKGDPKPTKPYKDSYFDPFLARPLHRAKVCHDAKLLHDKIAA